MWPLGHKLCGCLVGLEAGEIPNLTGRLLQELSAIIQIRIEFYPGFIRPRGQDFCGFEATKFVAQKVFHVVFQAPPSPAREARALGTKAGFWAYRFIGMFGLFILMLGRVWSAFVPQAAA